MPGTSVVDSPGLMLHFFKAAPDLDLEQLLAETRKLIGADTPAGQYLPNTRPPRSIENGWSVDLASHM
jgi:hypothetical protein